MCGKSANHGAESKIINRKIRVLNNLPKQGEGHGRVCVEGFPAVAKALRGCVAKRRGDGTAQKSKLKSSS